jgi:hypothetical protein
MQLNNSRSIVEEVMPGWNGNESIVAYVIRQRREREAKATARRARIRRWLIVGNLITWPLAGLVAIKCVELAL